MIWWGEGYFIELDDVGVAEDLQDADLSCNSFDISLLDDLLFLQGLHGHLLVGGGVDSQAHLAESALSDAPA